MKKYIIVGGTKSVWAVNPETHQKLKITSKEIQGKVRSHSDYNKNRFQILDVYANNSGIYHASPRKQEVVDGKKRRNYITNVQIYDTISGNPVVTITPDDNNLGLDFQFKRTNGSLSYELNGLEGIVFENCNSETDSSGTLAIDGKEVYYEGKKIAHIDENITYIKEVEAKKFQKAFKKKNRQRYIKNKAFFK